MIIDNFYISSVTFLPYETNTPLIINTDTVLTFTVTLKFF